MLKKLMLSVAMVSATSALYAYPAPYLGASVGIITNTNTVKANGSNFTGGAYRGVPFNLNLGYGGVVSQNFYLAGELFGTVGTANISDNTQLRTSYSYGGALLPGGMLSDCTIAYVRLGVVRAHFPDINDSRTGGQLGVGLQESIAQQVDLRGEYNFVAYEAQNEISGGLVSSVAPRSDQFTLGLIYKFE